MTTDREKLIEAFKSKASEWDSYDFDPDWDYSTEAAILADIALAVFENAHTPTGDEREAHRRVIDLWFANWRDIGKVSPALEVANDSLEGMVSDALDAGFHRTVRGEPTGEQVEAACLAYAEGEMSVEEWEWVKTQPEVVQPYLDGMRAALRAAAEVKP